jgi:hypothetical protein
MMNVHRSSCKYLLFLSDFNEIHLSRQIFENSSKTLDCLGSSLVAILTILSWLPIITGR